MNHPGIPGRKTASHVRTGLAKSGLVAAMLAIVLGL